MPDTPSIGIPGGGDVHTVHNSAAAASDSTKSEATPWSAQKQDILVWNLRHASMMGLGRLFSIISTLGLHQAANKTGASVAANTAENARATHATHAN
jgi:hypothetical protein